MDAYFKELGQTVLDSWKRENFSLEAFPEIARQALEKNPPSERVDLAAFTRAFLLDDEQPPQSQSPFGQPELVVFDHQRFYIQMLFWLDGTTEIHQHEFSGAFHVMAGSSIHAFYEFANMRPVTPHLRLGDVRTRGIELLETGRTVAIESGNRCIHSLFHLDTPSVTVVVRTQNDPGTSPQFNYLPPHMAVDPLTPDPLMERRRQLLDVLEVTGDPSYASLVGEMAGELDFERGFNLLRHTRESLSLRGEWEAVLAAFELRHGVMAEGVEATLGETARRDGIKAMRGSVTEPEHRFFLALLMNATNRADVLTLVAQRFPQQSALKTVMGWIEDLGDESEHGASILDAVFPVTLELPEGKQSGVFAAALGHFISGATKLPAVLRGLSPEDMNLLRAVFAASSLGILVGKN